MRSSSPRSWPKSTNRFALPGFPSTPSICRTYDGREVDLLLELEEGFVAFEIKKARRVARADIRPFHELEELLDKPLLSCLFCPPIEMPERSRIEPWRYPSLGRSVHHHPEATAKTSPDAAEPQPKMDVTACREPSAISHQQSAPENRLLFAFNFTDQGLIRQ